MSTPHPRLAGSAGGTHPALLARRMHDLMATGLASALALAGALAIAVAFPRPSVGLVLGIVLGGVGLLTLLTSARYEVTVTLLALYLGLLDGPLKLLTASQAVSAARDVLIFAIALGMAMRLSVSKSRLTLPPLSGWVVAFVAAVVLEAANPNTGGFQKVLGGFRQELEWVPFFFFGYLLVRNRLRFRKLLLVLGVIALANGVVGVYQSTLSPGGLGSWGPGYNARVTGTGGVAGRTYSVEGVGRPRPPALGADAGFGGGVGVAALPGLLALISVRRARRRWPALLLFAGALAAIGTAASRSSILIALVALLSYPLLSVIGGLKVTRLMVSVLVAVALAVGVGAALVAISGKGVFARQESLTKKSPAQTLGSGEAALKEKSLLEIPKDVAGAPFGIGLGTAGAAAGFGGKHKVAIEGRGPSGEGSLNVLELETGLPGILLWLGLTINVLLLTARRLRHVADTEIRTYLVAILSVFIAFTAEGFAGPAITASPGGIVMWLAIGIAAYWLAGPGQLRAPEHASAAGAHEGVGGAR